MPQPRISMINRTASFAPRSSMSAMICHMTCLSCRVMYLAWLLAPLLLHATLARATPKSRPRRSLHVRGSVADLDEISWG